MPFWSTSKPVIPLDPPILFGLETIGVIKNGLPLRQRGWCNELGLFVQLNLALQTLLAGGKYRNRIGFHWRSQEDDWQVDRFRHGTWEALVQPSLFLAEWLRDRSGLPSYLEQDLAGAVGRFKAGREFQLPVSARTIGEGPLASAAQIDFRVDEFDFVAAEPGLREYLDQHPDNPTARDALREVLFQKRDFKAALGQGLEAMKLAPKDGDIHFEVAKLYFAALTNESRIRRGATNDTPDELRGCTLYELGCSIDDAGQAVWQNSEAAVMSPTTEPSNQEAAQFMMDRLVGKGP